MAVEKLGFRLGVRFGATTATGARGLASARDARHVPLEASLRGAAAETGAERSGGGKEPRSRAGGAAAEGASPHQRRRAAVILSRDRQRRELSKEISSVQSVEAALAIAASTRPADFDHVHATACLHRVARLWAKDSPSEASLEALGSLFGRLAGFLRQPRLLDATAVAINAWSVAALGSVSEPWLRQVLPGLVAEALAQVREMPARGLANLAWSLATLQEKGEVSGESGTSALLRALAAEAPLRLHEFAPQGIANCYWAFCQLGGKDGDDFTPLRLALADEAMGRVSELHAQDLASIAWSAATSSTASPSLAKALAHEACVKLRHFSPRQLANLAWALATAAPEGTAATVGRLAVEAARRPPSQLVQRDLAGLCWALATTTACAGPMLSADPSSLHGAVGALASGARRRLSEYSTGALVGLSWSLAILRADSASSVALAAVDAVAGGAGGCDGLGAPVVARLMWTLATLKVAGGSLHHSLAAEAILRLDAFGPLDLANASWAVATLPSVRGAGSLTAAMAARAALTAPEFSPANLVQVAWAAATVSCYDENLSAALTRMPTSQACLHSCRVQDLALSAWAQATWGQGPDALPDSLLLEASLRSSEFASQDLSNLAWAMATLLVRHEPLLATLAREATRKIQQLQPQHLCNLVWSLATLGWQLGQDRDLAGREACDIVGSLSVQVSRIIGDIEHPGLSATSWALASLVGLRHSPKRVKGPGGTGCT
ncbi:unnamed protein product [Polarella glacialis]|uniref:RAP domain-containing protein n=1 Tax=Polarella glacialis TaxID=89957 RepID=A0A813J1U9_POLGL|nr:unnamed protein product [Polarella glacialis]